MKVLSQANETQREMMKLAHMGTKMYRLTFVSWTNNKCISVFKRKPYIIEVLVLCYVMGLRAASRSRCIYEGHHW